MPGLGTIINVAAIVVAGLLGTGAGKLLNERLQDGLVKASGVCVLFLGMAGALQGMLTVSGGGGSLVSGMSLFVVISVVAGTLIGEAIDIDALVRRFGEWLKRKTGNASDRTFVDAFVTASVTVCVGAMAMVGAVEDGMMGDEKDEADGWDETLVPIDAGKQYDVRSYRGERHITDDQLFKYLCRIRQEIGPKGTLYTIVDACHAGDVERDDDFQTIRGTNEGLTPNSKNKYNPPRQATHKRIMSSPELAPVLYVEACESYQRNQEVTYQRHEYGALSFNVWQTLKQHRVFPANIHAFEDALSKSIQRNKDEHNYLWPGTQDVVFSKSE